MGEKRNYDSDCRIALFYREIISQPHLYSEKRRQREIT